MNADRKIERISTDIYMHLYIQTHMQISAWPMKFVCLCLLLTTLPILSACDSMKGAAGFAGMGIGQAVGARPDRKLTYDLEIRTGDNTTLVFAGTTECPHSSTTVGAGYRTNAPEAMIRVDGQQWILSGINCQNEIVDKGPRRYVLYKVIDEYVAKQYFVASGASAQLTRISVSSVWEASTGSSVYLSKYHHGPYIYQKWFLKSTPPLVRAQADPIVLYEGTSICGRANKSGMQLDRRVFFETFERQPDVFAIEEGILEYEATHHVWKSRAGIEPSAPMDAVVPQPGTPHGCLTFFVDGRKFIVSDSTRYSWLYIPAERALYRFARLWNAPTEMWANTGWQACSRPPNISDFSPGTAYLIENKRGWPPKFSRQNADGTFSCKNTFPGRLGDSNWD